MGKKNNNSISSRNYVDFDASGDSTPSMLLFAVGARDQLAKLKPLIDQLKDNFSKIFSGEPQSADSEQPKPTETKKTKTTPKSKIKSTSKKRKTAPPKKSKKTPSKTNNKSDSDSDSDNDYVPFIALTLASENENN